MIISKKFKLEEWNDSTEEKILSFWVQRNIKFDTSIKNHYEGKRGSLWGNLNSFDMSKLSTKINIMRNDNNEIICQLEVMTFGQIITKKNKKYWELELESFESAMLKNDYKEAEWEAYNKKVVGNDLLGTLMAIILGLLCYYLVKNI